jgi:LPS sulfotransferase NodH
MLPERSCVVCGVQRSGTTLLCWALGDTGVVGRPEEYFLDGDPASFPPGWTFWEDSPLAHQHRVSDRRSYLELVYRLSTTPNGVFGAKLMWNNLPWVTGRLNGLPEFAGLTTAELFPIVFPDLRPVHLTRADRARQAISWAKAAQDGVWFASDEMPARPTGTPVYNFEFISKLEALIVEGENGWRDLFRQLGVTACEVTYEDLVTPDGYAATIRRIADHVGVDERDIRLPSPRSHRQTDDRNEEWLTRYRSDQQALRPPTTRGVVAAGEVEHVVMAEDTSAVDRAEAVGLGDALRGTGHQVPVTGAVLDRDVHAVQRRCHGSGWRAKT